MADTDFKSLVGKITNLEGGSNYGICVNDMHMCGLQNSCWNIVTSPLPAAELQTADWKTKDNWASEEIHLCCEADIQNVMIDSEHAYQSWSLLQAEYCKKGEQKVKREKKQFSWVTITENSCGEYMRKVKKIVSQLKECVEKIKDEDVAYPILLRLGARYSPLVVTWTNIMTSENPLSLARVSE